MKAFQSLWYPRFGYRVSAGCKECSFQVRAYRHNVGADARRMEFWVRNFDRNDEEVFGGCFTLASKPPVYERSVFDIHIFVMLTSTG